MLQRGIFWSRNACNSCEAEDSGGRDATPHGHSLVGLARVVVRILFAALVLEV